VAEVAVKRDLTNPADCPFREEKGRSRISVPRRMIPMKVNAMIRLML
jgi:hypothetical protein